MQADMCSFQLQALVGPVDAVLLLFGTLDDVLTNSRAVDCLKGAAAHLRPGGLCVIEGEHPGK